MSTLGVFFDRQRLERFSFGDDPATAIDAFLELAEDLRSFPLRRDMEFPIGR